ncbi:MAG: nucleotidyl transferase AbiEii/AbiGii toxin family protein [Planctomycetota bacterium]
MSESDFLHDHDQFEDLLRIEAGDRRVLPSLVEKDYWVMHVLWGLGRLGWTFELKGGTSLSKGFGLIRRFSEDLDLRIAPEAAPFSVSTRKNQSKPKHVETRRRFFDWLAKQIEIPGIVAVARDTSFDDRLMRSAGIRLTYESPFEVHPELKEGILLEVGFDQTRPSIDCAISSWAFDRARGAAVACVDNRALGVSCYHPGYTLVEKLQAISTTYRTYVNTGISPANFIRHYFDVRHQLEAELVREFIGTEKYRRHKAERFRREDEPDLTLNPAFLLEDPAKRAEFAAAFHAKRDFYFGNEESFEEILERIREDLPRL